MFRLLVQYFENLTEVSLFQYFEDLTEVIKTLNTIKKRLENKTFRVMH